MVSTEPHTPASDPFLKMISSRLGLDVFSAKFVWDPKFSTARFGAFLGGDDGVGRQSLLEAVAFSPMDQKLRRVMFPTPFHPGSTEHLAVEQRTYEAIGEAVDSSCVTVDVVSTEKFVKQTAHALAELAGGSTDAFRSADPVRFARTVWLFCYLKKTRSSSVVGILKPPGPNAKPSLEITNPYRDGAQIERRALFADVATYLALQLPTEKRERIDLCVRFLLTCVNQRPKVSTCQRPIVSS